MNLLVLSVDTLRLDHAPGQSAGVLAPRFEAAVRDFAFWERCFSVSSATRPVHTSLVTGLVPFEHGIQGQQDRHVRRGAPRLFALFRDAGCAVSLRSEAASIFTGIDLGAPVADLDPRPDAGLQQLRDWLARPQGQRRCLFVHYWGAHTPYGAADGLALGATARLLREGGGQVVRDRYRAAVERVLERQLAPLLDQLDLSRWAVVIFGDHGESWTSEEPYHGTTLRNSVLRVPMWMHVPFVAVQRPGDQPLVSLLDLFPTLCALFDLPCPAASTFGRDLLAAAATPRFLWAEVRPGPMDDTALRTAAAGPQAAGSPPVRWCVLDEDCKLLGDGDDWELVDTWSERPAPDAGKASRARPYLEARASWQRTSAWVRLPLETGDPGDEELVRRRLQALGYLA